MIYDTACLKEAYTFEIIIFCVLVKPRKLIISFRCRSFLGGDGFKTHTYHPKRKFARP
jgi:hypothetical protein